MSFLEHWPLAVRIVLLATLVFVINIPFGAWRVRTVKRTIPWILSIHVPIPFLFLLRRGLGLSAWYIAISLVAAVLAQILGGRLFPSDSAGKKTDSR